MQMHTFHGKRRQQVLALLLACSCFLWTLLSQPAIILAAFEDLLNDRSADIIGSTPLLVPGVLTPQGLSGRGQIIGLADSGLDKGLIGDLHPDLQSDPGTMPRVAIVKSYAGRQLPDDPTGHGTHMAGIIAGSGKASDGKYRGIAPGATLYVQGLLDASGRVSPPPLLETLFSPAYDAGVRIHVNGWGGGSNTYSGNSAQIDDFVFEHPDFLPLFGAGNSGPGIGTLTTEANSKNALTVGSSQVPRPAYGPDARDANQPASTSSRGPAGDGRIKPELMAPGSAVISSCSRMIESNFAADPDYTRMGGTSMATAVTGGALALSREYLRNYTEYKAPSSALMKALLVNGARTPENPSAEKGFGILDLAGTLFSVQEKQFMLVDENNPLHTSEEREYRYTVNNAQGPLKATLAWVDPPGRSGSAASLINNLDLELEGPDGKLYRGNAFLNKSEADYKNNIEQVVIPFPTPGTYTIRVKAAALNSAYPDQNYALVYGQKIEGQTIQSINDDHKLIMEDGQTTEIPSNAVAVVNQNIEPAAQAARPGALIYSGQQRNYMFSVRWHTGGIQILDMDKDLVLEMNHQARDGGRYIQEGDQPVTATVNGKQTSLDAVPVGAELMASISPLWQTVYEMRFDNQEVSGVIQSVDMESKKITLFHESQQYPLAPWAAMSYVDTVLDCSAADTPYLSAEPNTLDQLVPGTKVSMQVSPLTREVQHIMAHRQMIIGRIEEIDTEKSQIRLDTGQLYTLFKGATIFRNQEQADLQDLKAGDSLMAMILPETKQMVFIKDFSRVDYGRLVYYSPNSNEVCILDQNNQLSTYKVDRQTDVFEWGTKMDLSSLQPGMWVRVAEDPDSNEAWSIDVAQSRDEEIKVFRQADLKEHTLTMNDGSVYPYTNATRISKAGHSIDVSDLIPGERLRLTMLEAAHPWKAALAAAEVQAMSVSKQPMLEITARNYNGVLIIQGETDGRYLYLYRENGERVRIDPDETGQFSRLLPARTEERYLRALAFAVNSPAVRGKDISITAYQANSVTEQFSDIQGHPAQMAIMNLAERKVIRGCGNGIFNPDQPITRTEFVALLARLRNLNLDSIDDTRMHPFKDQSNIPWWGLESVLAVSQKGWISGDGQGRFQPARYITAAEAMVILARMYDTGSRDHSGRAELPFPDARFVPFWALDSYSYAYQHGYLTNIQGGSLHPLHPLTRGEAAILLQ